MKVQRLNTFRVRTHLKVGGEGPGAKIEPTDLPSGNYIDTCSGCSAVKYEKGIGLDCISCKSAVGLDQKNGKWIPNEYIGSPISNCNGVLSYLSCDDPSTYN
ncbi:MAG: hypothetical protein NT121_02340 [Chloroflexi bacterium]|nr:hypothetical protein [Chloroflexota bacterium]